MKISVNDTQVVTKNVWISRIIIQEKPPHKKSMPVTQHFQPHCEDSPESTEAQLSAEFPWRWRHTCSNFLPRERESRGFLNEILINRLTLRASSTYTVPCSSCLRLHHNIFPFAFTWQPNSLFPLSHEIWLFCSLSPPLGDIQTLSELDSI